VVRAPVRDHVEKDAISWFLYFATGFQSDTCDHAIFSLREVFHQMSVSEVLGRYEQIFQSASSADVKLTLVGIGHLQPPALIRENFDFIVLNREFPGLAIVAGRSKSSVSQQEFELFFRICPGREV
jgi:hypothetical protein